MALTKFLESLFENGRVQVPEPDRIAADDLQNAAAFLKDTEKIWRSNQPDGLPEFDVEPALWAAEVVFRSAQFQVFRDVNAEFIEQAFQQTETSFAALDRSLPQTHYSADLCLRYLPDVLRLVRSGAADDPLVQIIESLLKDWPLSAVGVQEIELVKRPVAFRDEGLWKLYIDRIIERSDKRLLSDPDVHHAVTASVGAFPQLVPALVNFNRTATEQSQTDTTNDETETTE